MKSMAKSELFRELPSVDEVLRTPNIAALVEIHGQSPVTDAARVVLARLRDEINTGLLESAGRGFLQ